ncbi:Uu.00g007810.m01.CDS01 [Anthostomella pinea]|uniref:Neutral protease 2 n=1 Tax=Anthostomella pinea TaxID=933095 RepID=A0AAI8YMG2_9PEZI|nr:Uu.00g007810.m01.CDS01 [Anthostomella pinea]
MKCARVLLALSSVASTVQARFAGAVNHSKRSPSLEVTLAPATEGIAELVATIKNVGSADLNLLKVGTLLDERLPVQKVLALDEAGVEAPFRGIHASIQHAALRAEHFQLLKASEIISMVINVAAVHDFTASGTYTFKASGLMPFANAGSAELIGPALTYESNTISLYVDAQKVASVPKALSARPLEERTEVQEGCNATQLAASTAALANCEILALAAAADAADPSSARFVEYFRTNSSTTRQTVVDRLTAVAADCATTDSGPSRYFCYDYYGICESSGPLNAYTLWDVSTSVMCSLFYDTLPPLPQGCHRQDQATTTIHEITHCEAVYSPHTNDYAYAYNESIALTPAFALLNADNYSLFANAVYMKC